MQDHISLTFDDVLILPTFSFVKSRKDVDTSTTVAGVKLNTAIISSNMECVTGSRMSNAMRECGAVGALHRFQSIEDNVKMFLASHPDTIGSFGLGQKEMERAEALVQNGCDTIILDVANGASLQVVEQVRLFRDLFKNNVGLIVGNFATGQSVLDFLFYGGNSKVDAIKVGIGGGSACLTRIVTGCGANTLGSIIDIVGRVTIPVIADGGIRNSGDYSKALAAGARAVMMGGLLAGCEESPSENIYNTDTHHHVPTHKKYRGSASQESYEAQGKVASHRSHEGDSFLVPYTGPVAKTLEQFQGGLRSAMSYVNATNLEEFRENAQFIEISQAGAKESHAHGRNRT